MAHSLTTCFLVTMSEQLGLHSCIMPAVRSVVFECVWVVVIGVAVGLVANRISPKGLTLSRNYFPPTPKTSSATPLSSAKTRGRLESGVTNELERVKARLARRGLRVILHTNAVQVFQSLRREANNIVFIDSREDKYYREAHIPGAYQLDYYRPEKHIEEVLPICLAAEQVVVYCNGGDCEDSELSAVMLTEFGVDKQRLVVYAEGFTVWKKMGMPCEIGERLSGNIVATRDEKPTPADR